MVTPSPEGSVHELAIAEAVIDGIRDQIGVARVTRVFLEVGTLSCVEPDAIRFCFELCAQGTTVEGAAVEIAPVPGDRLLVRAVELA
jgi:hydrogenase nickel incorporation protein HypA/HybF